MTLPQRDPIPIAAAAEIAALLPNPSRRSGAWWRTRALCHDGDAPDSLAFRDADKAGQALTVRCHSRACDPDAIRHAIQAATGRFCCRCDRCWTAWRAGQPPPGPAQRPHSGPTAPPGRRRHRTAHTGSPQHSQDAAQRPHDAARTPQAPHRAHRRPTAPPEAARTPHSTADAPQRTQAAADAPQNAQRPHSAARQPTAPPEAARTPHSTADAAQSTTSDFAAGLWAAALPIDRPPRPGTPVARWLTARDLWPAGEPLPAAVRVITRAQLPRGRQTRPNSPAVAALVLAMRTLDNPAAPPRKVQLVAIDAAGHKAPHWQTGAADKRTYGQADAPAYGLLWRGQLTAAPYHLHACEGLADGLRILRYAADPAIVAVCAGKSYQRIAPAWFASVTLWPDADDPNAEAEARATAQAWANAGFNHIGIARVPPGHDPASAPLRQPAHASQSANDQDTGP